MREVLLKKTVKPEVDKSSVETACESIFSCYKQVTKDGNIPVKMAYNGTIHQLVSELKGLGFEVDGNWVKSNYGKLVEYLNTKYPENIPGTNEHKAAYPKYYEAEVEEVSKE